MTKFKLIIEDRAIDDIQDVINYYDLILAGLGLKFKNQAISEMRLLVFNPNKFRISYSDVRVFQLKKYPYLIHYRVSETSKTVNIVSIFHTSRNPNIWIEDI